MARIETLNETATTKLKAIAATKFKGVRNRPTSNNMSECALIAAKMAAKHGLDFFVVPTGLGMVISHKPDAEASYRDFGYGVRITPNAEIYSNPLAA